MGRIGLVAEGGGMKCVYGAAIMDRLLDEGYRFDYAIGVSAGAANMASYLAGQRGRSMRFYTEHSADPEYMGKGSWKAERSFFGLHYIYGTLTNTGGRDPIDYDALMSNPTEAEVVVTRATDAAVRYLSLEGLERDNYLPFMASAALPIACRPIYLDDEPYFDGGIIDPLPVEHALGKGCDRLVVVAANPHDIVKPPQSHLPLVQALLKPQYPAIGEAIATRHLPHRVALSRAHELEQEGRCVICAPTDTLGVSTGTHDTELLKRFYERGLEDYEQLYREPIKRLFAL